MAVTLMGGHLGQPSVELVHGLVGGQVRLASGFAGWYMCWRIGGCVDRRVKWHVSGHVGGHVA